MSRARHIPIRTCIGCGVRTPQAELLRLASVPDGSVQIVDGAPGLGRSGYLHRCPECWERFAARKGPVRSLRRNIDKNVRIAVVQRLKAVEPSAMVR